jgi:uncharacterized phage-associated protein
MRTSMEFKLTQNADIQDVCDYIITRMEDSGKTLSVLGLQKLLYLAQGWHLAFYGAQFFEGRFQAWAQGPVNLKIYERFAGRPLGSRVSSADLSKDFDGASISEEKSNHIRSVLEAYAECEDSSLNEIMSKDASWVEARSGCLEHCQREIEEDNMRRFCVMLYLLKQFGTRGPYVLQIIPVPAFLEEWCESAQELVLV